MASREQESQLLAALNKSVGKNWTKTRKTAPQTNEALKLPEGEYPMQLSKLIFQVDKKEKFPVFYLRVVVLAPDEFKGKTGMKSYRIVSNDYGTADEYMGRFIADCKLFAPEIDWDNAELKDLPKLLEKVSDAKPTLRMYAQDPKNPKYGSNLFVNGRFEGDELEQILAASGGSEDEGEEYDETEGEGDETENEGDEGEGDEGEFVPVVGDKYRYPASDDKAPFYEVIAVYDTTCDLKVRDAKTKRTKTVKAVPFEDLGDFAE